MTDHAKGSRRCDADVGFSLIEVIVALVLLGIVATAALYFFLQGTRTTSSLQRSQNAVAIANEAMERAYAVNPQDNPVSGVGGLVVGRAKADVDAAWTALGGLAGDSLGSTYPLWDSGAVAGTEPAVPLSYTVRHSTQEYTVWTLIGSCYRSASVTSTDQVCGKLAGKASDSDAGASSSGTVRMLRVISVVTWEPLGDECGTSLCSYHLSGLIDRSEDLEWNQIIEPVAVDDFESFDYGETRAIDVLANDLIGPVTSNPVEKRSDLPTGGGQILNIASNGLINYQAPANRSGKFTFTYRIKDARGALSPEATVEITLFPESANDSARVLSGQANVLNILANDRGSESAQSVQIVSGPSNGGVTVVGTTVTYTPAVTTGGDSFTYTYTDASGQESLPAVVSILIDHITVQDHALEVPMRTSGAATWVDLTPTLFTGNTDTAGWTINIVGAAPGPTLGSLQIGSGAYTGLPASGANVSYNPPQNAIGTDTFIYSLTNAVGLTSQARSVTLTIVGMPTVSPVAVTDNLGNFRRNGTREFSIGANDLPSRDWAANGISVETRNWRSSCGGVASNQSRLNDGILRVDVPGLSSGASSRDCNFDYRLRDTTGNTSDWVRVDYRIVRN